MRIKIFSLQLFKRKAVSNNLPAIEIAKFNQSPAYLKAWWNQHGKIYRFKPKSKHTRALEAQLDTFIHTMKFIQDRTAHTQLFNNIDKITCYLDVAPSEPLVSIKNSNVLDKLAQKRQQAISTMQRYIKEWQAERPTSERRSAVEALNQFVENLSRSQESSVSDKASKQLVIKQQIDTKVQKFQQDCIEYLQKLTPSTPNHGLLSWSCGFWLKKYKPSVPYLFHLNSTIKAVSASKDQAAILTHLECLLASLPNDKRKSLANFIHHNKHSGILTHNNWVKESLFSNYCHSVISIGTYILSDVGPWLSGFTDLFSLMAS